jgi:formate hydrogenlyase subunit 3/multisubunit Na+/H+ antiporter MnhD subunit
MDPNLINPSLPPLSGFSRGLFKTAGTNPETRLSQIISNLIGILTIFGGLAFLTWFVIGAFTWASSGGNQEQLNKAKSQMSTAVAGLFILILATGLVWLLGQITGLDIINLDKLIKKVQP